MANIQIHEFHIKVRWLFGLATRKERSQLPPEFPKFSRFKDVVQALGATQQTFGMWCPLNPKKKDGTPAPQMDKPTAAFARNVARMFGFAPSPTASMMTRSGASGGRMIGRALRRVKPMHRRMRLRRNSRGAILMRWQRASSSFRSRSSLRPIVRAQDRLRRPLRCRPTRRRLPA